MVILCHELRTMIDPLLCTRVSPPPPVKKWGYVTNGQFTEAKDQSMCEKIFNLTAVGEMPY